MATAPGGTRLAPWLFGGIVPAVAALVVVLTVSTLTSILSAGLLMQLALGGGEMPREAVAAGMLFVVGSVFFGLGLWQLLKFLS